jgi:hypothetical protein
VVPEEYEQCCYGDDDHAAMQGTVVSEDGGIAGKGTAAPGEQARCLKKASVRLAWAGVGLINVGRPIDRMDQVVVWV